MFYFLSTFYFYESIVLEKIQTTLVYLKMLTMNLLNIWDNLSVPKLYFKVAELLPVALNLIIIRYRIVYVYLIQTQG